MEKVEQLAHRLGCTVVKKVERGWSSDGKFLLCRGGKRFLLRLSEIGMEQKRRGEFERIAWLSEQGLPVPRAICCGSWEQGFYQLLEWIEGEDLREVLPGLTADEQYRLGVEASRILRKLHTLPLNPDQARSASWQREKILRRMQEYEDSGVRMQGDRQAMRFVREKVELVGARPSVWCHGDYHAGNLIYTPKGEVAVIDFNRMCAVDPYEEFYKVQLFDREDSIPFAVGRLDGFFEGKVPDSFWPVQKLYSLYASLYSILWAIPFGEQEIAGMRRRYEDALNSYADLSSPIPQWYAAYKWREK